MKPLQPGMFFELEFYSHSRFNQFQHFQGYVLEVQDNEVTFYSVLFGAVVTFDLHEVVRSTPLCLDEQKKAVLELLAEEYPYISVAEQYEEYYGLLDVVSEDFNTLSERKMRRFFGIANNSALRYEVEVNYTAFQHNQLEVAISFAHPMFYRNTEKHSFDDFEKVMNEIGDTYTHEAYYRSYINWINDKHSASNNPVVVLQDFNFKANVNATTDFRKEFDEGIAFLRTHITLTIDINRASNGLMKLLAERLVTVFRRSSIDMSAAYKRILNL